MKSYLTAAIALLLTLFTGCKSTDPYASLPRVVVSTDIGGTDPDDNQSMLHLLMYNDKFDLEGLVSTASYGPGSAEEILRMIDFYEKDFPVLKKAYPLLRTPDELRAITRQGCKDTAPWEGYAEPTPGSELIVDAARRDDARPLWVLVWGCLEDVAQALHDAPDIAPKLRVYWIGGPNKKWGAAGYSYIARNFPDLWIIENNSSYRGFIGSSTDPGHYQTAYYDDCIRGAGAMGEDFINYYKGVVRMGDTPSVLYMMDGDPEDPEGDSWGGRFEKMSVSSFSNFKAPMTLQDTIPVYGVLTLEFEAPAADVPAGKPCFHLTVDRQNWAGYQVAPGRYQVRYSPKYAGDYSYTVHSEISALDGQKGNFVASRLWPDPDRCNDPVRVGDHWYTDVQDPAMFQGDVQGYHTVAAPRSAALDDWAERWALLKEGR